MDYEHLPKEFEGIVEKTKYQAPEIDIKEEVESYVEGVIKKPEEEREYLIKNFIENKVKLVLSQWKSEYRQNDEIIENIEDHLKSNNEDTQKANKKINNLRNREKSVKSELHQNQKFIEDVEKNPPKSNLNKKVTLYFLIIVAVGLATLTAYKFSLAMGDIHSAMHNKEKLSLAQYIIYGFGAFAILATGKIINVIYEKINHSKKYFIAIATLAILLSGFSAYYLASDQAFLNQKTQLTTDLIKINNEISDLRNGQESYEEDSGETQASNNSNDKGELTELLSRKKELEKNLKSMKKDVIGLDETMLILILFTEMLIGGTAWMYATDYSRYVKEEERMHAIKTTKEHIENNKNELVNINEEIKKTEDDIENLRLETHDLNRVLADIKTEKEIEKTIDLIIDNETNNALAYLWKASKDKAL